MAAKKKVSKKAAKNSPAKPATHIKGSMISEEGGSGATKKELTSRDVITAILSGFGEEGTNDKQDTAKSVIRNYLKQKTEKHSVAGNYNLLLLYDETTMVQGDVDSIYTSVAQFSEQKPILLLVHSAGGVIVPAYLIGKMLYEYSGKKLDVVVPRRAKSAATLLCCAADHIHMGSLSELGPIDPQIDHLPALGLKSAIQHIAELVAEHPNATELFARYMSQTIKPIHLGYYERVAESACIASAGTGKSWTLS